MKFLRRRFPFLALFLLLTQQLLPISVYASELTASPADPSEQVPQAPTEESIEQSETAPTLEPQQLPQPPPSSSTSETTPTPTPVPTASATPTPEPSLLPSPQQTLTTPPSSSTPTPVPTPSAVSSHTPNSSPAASSVPPSPSLTPTALPQPSPSATPAPVPTPSIVPSPSPSPQLLQQAVTAAAGTFPVITFTNPVEAGPVTHDDVTITVTDDNLATYGYAMTSATCGPSLTYQNFTSGQTFTFSDQSQNGQYVCVTAVDEDGNRAYVSSNHPLNIDVSGPQITFTDNVSVGPVQVENIAVEIFDPNLDTYSFVYTTNTICDASTNFSEALGPGEFTSAISVEDHNGKYLCFRAVDRAGNTSYQRSQHPLNIDATAPTITFTDNVEMGPVSSDTVKIATQDIHLDQYAYGFSTDQFCTASDTYNQPFINDQAILFNDETHNGQYLCVRSMDEVGNVTYLASAYPLNIDAQQPAIELIDDVEVGPVKEDIIDVEIHEANLSALNYYASIDTTCDTSDINLGVYNEVDNIVINVPDHNGKYLCFSATDDVGNVMWVISQHPLNIDHLVPEITIVDNVETTPVREDRIVITVNEDDLVSLKYGFSEDAGCGGFDTYEFDVVSGQEFFINDVTKDGLYVCFQAIDQAGHQGYAQSNRPLMLDNTIEEVYFANDVSGEFVTDEVIVGISTVGNNTQLDVGYSSDPVCDASDVYVDTTGSGQNYYIDDATHNGQYVCLRATNSTGDTFFAASSNPLNIEPMPEYYDMIYVYDEIPDEVVDSIQVTISLDTYEFDIVQTGFAFSSDSICDAQDVYTGFDENSLWTPGNWDGYYVLNLTEETYNGQYLCLMAAESSGRIRYIAQPMYFEQNPVQIDVNPPTISIVNDVQTQLTNQKTFTVQAQDSYLHQIEYGLSDSGACDYYFPDSNTDYFSHVHEYYRPYTSQTVTHTLTVDGEYEGRFICARAIDVTGKMSAVFSSPIVNIDTVPATISVTDSVSAQTTTNDTIAFSVYEEGNVQSVAYGFSESNCTDITPEEYAQIFINPSNYVEGDPSTYTTNFNFALATEDHNGKFLCVFVNDQAGNQTVYRSEHVVSIDLTPPNLTFIDGLESTPVNNDQVVIQLGEANLSIFAWGYSTQQSCNQNAFFVQTLTDLNDVDEITLNINSEDYNGQYLCFYLVDQSGNEQYVTSPTPVEIDATEPEIVIEPGDDETEIVLSSNEDVTYYYAHCGGPSCSCQVPPEDYIEVGEDGTISLIDDDHVGEYICIIAVDEAGNETTTVAGPIVGSQQTEPSPNPESTASPTPVPTPLPTPELSPSPVVTPTPAASPSPSPVLLSILQSSPSPQPSPSSSPSVAPTPSPSSSPSPAASPSPSSSSPSPSPSPSPSNNSNNDTGGPQPSNSRLLAANTTRRGQVLGASTDEELLAEAGTSLLQLIGVSMSLIVGMAGSLYLTRKRES